MKFWKDNKIAGEFDWPVQAVADAFCIAVTQGDWPLKLDSWPLDRVLRDWLTLPGGFASTWDIDATGPESYDHLYQLVREQVYG